MKKNKYEVKQSNTSLYLMFGMLTMVVLYLAYVFYQINWVFYILSSIFIVCITSEGKPLAALIMYLLVSGLSLVYAYSLCATLYHGIWTLWISKVLFGKNKG